MHYLWWPALLAQWAKQAVQNLKGPGSIQQLEVHVTPAVPWPVVLKKIFYGVCQHGHAHLNMRIMCRACRVVNHIIKCKFSSDLVGINSLIRSTI